MLAFLISIVWSSVRRALAVVDAIAREIGERRAVGLRRRHRPFERRGAGLRGSARVQERALERQEAARCRREAALWLADLSSSSSAAAAQHCHQHGSEHPAISAAAIYVFVHVDTLCIGRTRSAVAAAWMVKGVDVLPAGAAGPTVRFGGPAIVGLGVRQTGSFASPPFDGFALGKSASVVFVTWTSGRKSCHASQSRRAAA